MSCQVNCRACSRTVALVVGVVFAMVACLVIGFFIGFGAFKASAETSYITAVIASNGTESFNVTGNALAPLVFHLDTGLGLSGLELVLLLAVLVLGCLWLYCLYTGHRGTAESVSLTYTPPNVPPPPKSAPILRSYSWRDPNRDSPRPSSVRRNLFGTTPNDFESLTAV